MATPEKTNFAKLCRMILDLLCEIQRDVLTAYQDPNTFPIAKILGDQKLRLDQHQTKVVNDIPNLMNYSQLDNSILYKLIRNLCPSGVQPISGWGKDVNPSDENLPDDIERIRQIRNNFAHAKGASINKVEYEEVVEDIRDICSRFDTKHGNILTLQGAGNYCQTLSKIERESLDATSTVKKYQRHFKDLLKYLENEQIDMKKRLTKLEAGEEQTKKDIQNIDQRLDSYDQTLESHDQRLDSLEKPKERQKPAVATEKDFTNFVRGYKKKIETNSLPTYAITRKFDVDTTPEEAVKSSDSIMIKGEAGIGKSQYANLIECRWARGETLVHIAFLLMFRCKDINKDLPKHPESAPIHFSRARDTSMEEEEEVCKTIGRKLKFHAKQGNLLIIIDGIDELSLDNNCLTKKCRDVIECKVTKGDDITGFETLLAIMFGIIYTKSIILVFGREFEINKLAHVNDIPNSMLFHKGGRKVLSLLPISPEDVMKLTCMTVCGKEKGLHVNTEIKYFDTECGKVYRKFQDIQFKNIPSFAVHLIEIFKNIPSPVIKGKVTKTKVFIALLLNQLKNHTELGTDADHASYKPLFRTTVGKEFKECLQSLAEIALQAFLHNEVMITGNQEIQCGDFIIYNGIKLNTWICAKLDMFYIRSENYQVSIEAHHLQIMEFFAACAFACRKEQWSKLLELHKERSKIIIPLMAGLISKDDDFIDDFMINALDFVVETSATANIDGLYEWMFTIDACKLPGEIYAGWSGLTNDGRKTPPFALINAITEESQRPNRELLPTSLEYHCIGSRNDVKDLVGMKGICNLYDVNGGVTHTNITTYLAVYPGSNIKVTGNVRVCNNGVASLVSMLIQIRGVELQVSELNLESGVDDAKNLGMLSFPEELDVDGRSKMFCSIMDVVAGKVSRISSTRIRWLAIANADVVHVKNMMNLLDAALHVDVFELLTNFTKEQWKEIERLMRCNTDYFRINLVLDRERVDDSSECWKVLRHMQNLHFS